MFIIMINILLPVMGLLFFVGAARYSNMIGDPTTTVESISESAFPKSLRRKLTAWSEQIASAELQFVSDTKSRRRSINMFARNYLSRDHRSHVEFACHRQFRWSPAVLELAATSVLSNGTVLQSSSRTELPECMKNVFKDAAEESNFILNPTGESDPSKLYRNHQAFVRSQIADGDDNPVKLSRDSILALNEYVMNVMDWHLFQHGIIHTPPFDSDSSEKTNHAMSELRSKLSGLRATADLR